jgi:hypothetical protein
MFLGEARRCAARGRQFITVPALGKAANGRRNNTKTEVTVETDRVLIIRRRLTKRGWCRECACEVDMVELSEVQALTNKSQLELHDGSLSQSWHFSEDVDGSPLVCLESLLKSL